MTHHNRSTGLHQWGTSSIGIERVGRAQQAWQSRIQSLVTIVMVVTEAAPGRGRGGVVSGEAGGRWPGASRIVESRGAEALLLE